MYSVHCNIDVFFNATPEGCTVVLKHNKIGAFFMYVCPYIIYENDERYQLDAKIYLLL